MAGALGCSWRVSLRSEPSAERGVFDRYATADRERIAACRPRIFVHAYRRNRAISAHARKGCVLSDGMGRQRSSDRTPRAELLWRTLRSIASVRPFVRAARQAREASDSRIASEFHRAVRTVDRRRREGVRTLVATSRVVGGLVDDLCDHRSPFAAYFSVVLPA